MSWNTCVRAVGATALIAFPCGRAAAEQGLYTQPTLHGDRIVFQSGGDLWSAAVPAEGATALAHRLTSAAGVEARPTFSPDGTQVAFVGSFDGNQEVFVMPASGGAPRRLTFNPAREAPLGWTPDGTKVLIRSDRANPHSDYELFVVPAAGGPVEPLPFGEGSLGSFNRATGELAFSPRSNETWFWKGYRGGTAPDIWTTDRDFKAYRRATTTESNELFPMWVGDRLWFLADDDGRMNLWSCKTDGSDRTKHTSAGTQDFDLRWASADASGAPRIVFSQGSDLFLFDVATGKARKLGIALQGDRLEARERIERVGPTITQLALSPDASRLAIVSRGEVLVGPVGKPAVGVPQSWLQIPGLSASREAAVSWTGGGDLLMISDQGGEASIVQFKGDGLPLASRDLNTVLFKGDRWLFAPVASPDGSLVAFGDKSLRINVLDVATRTVRTAGTSPAGEVVDYRFSPDGRWLAWIATLPNGFGQVHLYDTRSSTDHTVSTGMTDDRFARWDPKGQYLYVASARAINPQLDQFDLTFVTRDAWQFFALPLRATVPPPLRAEAALAGVDLAKWASPPEAPSKGDEAGTKEASDQGKSGSKPAVPPIDIDLDGLMRRAALLPAEPGTFRDVHAVHGGLVYLRVPQQGVADEEWPPPVLGTAGATLERLDLAKGESAKVVEYPVNFASVSGSANAIVLATTTPDGAGASAPAAAAPGDGRLRPSCV